MEDTTNCVLDRACKNIATQSMSEGLAFGIVLLSCECIRDGVDS
jgi:hypothetical protein